MRSPAIATLLKRWYFDDGSKWYILQRISEELAPRFDEGDGGDGIPRSQGLESAIVVPADLYVVTLDKKKLSGYIVHNMKKKNRKQ